MTTQTSNYSPFSCIANFGVVPLFLFAFFLLIPSFLSRLCLLDVVAFVFDTIASLLFHCQPGTNLLTQKHFKIEHLPSPLPFVKTLLLLLCCISFLPNKLIASEIDTKLGDFQNIIISQGEHTKIPVFNLKKFTITNGDVVSHKLNANEKLLLLKGKKTGFTELVIWHLDKTKTTYRICVLTKDKHLKILHLAQSIKSAGLTTELSGTIIVVDGILDSLDNYLLVKKIERQNADNLYFKGSLSPKLRNLLIGKVYNQFFKEHIDDVFCYDQFYSIYCQFPHSQLQRKELIDHLSSNFFINFIPTDNGSSTDNYFVTMKLIQIEKLDGEELDFGLEKFAVPLKDIFENGIWEIIQKNQVLLSSRHLHISTLAEPETIIRPDLPATVEIGSEIPFISTSETSATMNTSWKFAGLRITLDLKQIGSRLLLSYQTELTQPSNGSNAISGSKEKSSLLIDLHKPQQIFQIGFKTNGNSVEQMPWLGQIPILGELFKSKSTQTNYKKITGIIIIHKKES